MRRVDPTSCPCAVHDSCDMTGPDRVHSTEVSRHDCDDLFASGRIALLGPYPTFAYSSSVVTKRW